MPVVFDEVSATVEPEAPAAAAPSSAEEEGGKEDPRDLFRELRRRAAREARLRAD